MKIKSLVLTLFIILSLKSNLAISKLKVEGIQIKDEKGRIVILRGINSSQLAKIPPFLPLKQAKELDPLPKWGFNLLRLAFSWEAFEAKKGKYDYKYLSNFKQRIDWAHQRGLMVLVDIHQDGFSRYSIEGCGNGFPEWTIPNGVKKFKPDNGPKCANWHVSIFFNRDLRISYDHFYNNANGVRTRYLNMLSLLAKNLKDHPAVIGYDLINEPWGDPNNEIIPLYRDSINEIRKHSPQTIIFVSPHGLPSSKVVSQRPPFENIVYAPHYYAASINPFKRWSGENPINSLMNSYRKAQSWQVPLFIGEFGGPGAAKGIDEYTHSIYNFLDNYFVSGAQWDYVTAWNSKDKDGWNQEDFSIVNENGELRKNFHPRPYAQLISGQPIKLKVGELYGGLSFYIKWDHNPKLGESVFFVPGLIEHKDKFSIKKDDDLKCRFIKNKDLLACSSKKKGPKVFNIKKLGV